MKKSTLTRRDFIRIASVAPFAGALTSVFKLEGFAEPLQQHSRVVLIRNEKAVAPSGKLNQTVIAEMLDEAIAVLFDEKDPAEAWKKIVQPEDTVGIKSNVWHYLPTGPEVETYLKQRTMAAGVPEKRIGIDDRGVLRNPVFQKATVLINARPGRTHHWSGIGGCIKNHIMFVPNPAAYHADTCADLGKIWHLPPVKNRTKLNIMTMLTPLFHGIGPHHYSDSFIWPYKGILVSRDPVAVDAIGLKIIEAKRREFFGKDRPVQPTAHHIRYAETRHKLGVSDPDRIELIRLGFSRDILI